MWCPHDAVRGLRYTQYLTTGVYWCGAVWFGTPLCDIACVAQCDDAVWVQYGGARCGVSWCGGVWRNLAWETQYQSACNRPGPDNVSPITGTQHLRSSPAVTVCGQAAASGAAILPASSRSLP